LGDVYNGWVDVYNGWVDGGVGGCEWDETDGLMVG